MQSKTSYRSVFVTSFGFETDLELEVRLELELLLELERVREVEREPELDLREPPLHQPSHCPSTSSVRMIASSRITNVDTFMLIVTWSW